MVAVRTELNNQLYFYPQQYACKSTESVIVSDNNNKPPYMLVNYLLFFIYINNIDTRLKY
jgi:hypothetical protein